ncbi:flagellar protein FlgN [Desulfuribacillus alkaliarsenatis]|uniref:Flagellar biosynthesis protein FlgN n=1 Tax=Desulfuribacillus alkaliarsenatis TaxID=766136 RepID=A0A1E5G3Y4_9FIRM|nr:flagellar protein FlgN [Desulfuribacillus alkaliarsenatis]OEF97705.1 hypothetical protein BHF68_13990 [Desulfuribacillus alkaliarsenatis]
MKFIEKFCEILSEQLTLHEKLLTLSQDKKTILIEGSLPKLEKIIKEEHNLIQESRHLEKDRNAMIQQLAESLKIAPDNVTISFLIEVVQEDIAKQRLSSLKEKLEEVLKELSQVNQLNAKLLKQSLEYIQTTMESITDDPEQEMVYGNPSKSNAKKGRSVFDTRT